MLPSESIFLTGQQDEQDINKCSKRLEINVL
jgi:hypothetical protein